MFEHPDPSENEFFSLDNTPESIRHYIAMGMMTRSVLHELNQPLNAIKVNADTALFLQNSGKVILPGMILEILQEISQSITDISSLINQVRTHSSTSSDESFVPVALNSAVRAAISLTDRQLSGHQIISEVSLQETELPVPATPMLLEQLIFTLIRTCIGFLDKSESSNKMLKLNTSGDSREAHLIFSAWSAKEPKKDDQLEETVSAIPSHDDELYLLIEMSQLFLKPLKGTMEIENHSEDSFQISVSLPLARDINQ